VSISAAKISLVTLAGWQKCQ